VAYILKDSGSKILLVSSAIQLRKAEEIFSECDELKEIVTLSTLRKEHGDEVVTWEDAITAGEKAFKEHQEEIMKLSAGVEPKDVSALIYTSGTTGNPKGVMLTHENFCSNAKSALQVVEFYPEDHHMSFLPLCHSFERTAGYHAVLASGAKISFAESIEAVSMNLVEVRPTVMISVPRLFERIYNLILKSVEAGSPAKKRIFEWAFATGKKAFQAELQGKKVGRILQIQRQVAHKLVFSKLHDRLGNNLRFAVSGGAALPKEIGEFFQAANIPVLEGYGLTETAPVLAVNPMGRQVFGSVGHIMPGVTVAVQSLTDNSLLGQLTGEDYPSQLSTEPGEIICKGPNIMKGYWNQEEETKQVIDDEGWFHTGDVGKFENGYLKITDRIKHMIVSKGGKNIYPGPIEEKFTSVPYIDQVMVVGEAREYLTALVVPSIESLEDYAGKNGIEYADSGELIQHPEIIKLFEQVFKEYSRSAASHEKIRNFRLIEEAFSVENGYMTPTMKLKRKVIGQSYQELIEDMYEGIV
jgi:long-chain acyl-CoA synthetase